MPASPIRFGGASLGGYRHVCAFFHTPDEEYLALLPFIKDGIDCGDRGVNVVPDGRTDHVDRLRGAGIDVDTARAKDQLELLRSDDAYLRGGLFNQEAMLASIQEIMTKGRRLGFPLTRLVAHAECVFETWQGDEEFMQYEARLNELLPNYPDVVICTYDLSKVRASVAMDALRTHPIAIVGSVPHVNPFYVPPDILLAELRARAARGSASGAARV